MNLLSKELLSEVFGEEVTTDISVDFYEIDGVIQEWKVVWFNFKTYPLDFVAQKCKEWAFNLNSDKGGPIGGYPLFSRYGTTWQKSVCFCDKIDLNVPTQYADTEPEAIFKACDYILKEKQQ